MITVSVTEARKRFNELCDLVEKGETVVVTIRRKPAFEMVPHQKTRRLPNS